MWNNAKDKDLGISVDRVRELFDYDDEDGFLRWKVTRQKVVKGSIAGYVNSDGYRYVGFDYHELLAHRVIWFWKIGVWPKSQIDHEDKNRANNRWKNLREATNGQNGCNSNRRPNKTTGIRGIDIRQGKFRVRVHVSGREIVVGRFATLEEAIVARTGATKKYYGAFGAGV